jgi:CDK inhibitor PHO81
VQPVFNREFIAELSDVASANLLSLDNLLGSDSEGRKRRGAESLADGTGIEGYNGTSSSNWTMEIEQADSAEALEDLEHALVLAVRARDQETVDRLLAALTSPGNAAARATTIESRSPVSRILWRAILEDSPAVPTVQTSSTIIAVGPVTTAAPVPTTTANPSATTTTTPGIQLYPSAIPTSLLDFTFVDDINGRTSLHEAAIAGRLYLVKICLEKGVKLSQADVYGRHPLHYAAINGHAQVCKLLIASGADPTIADLDGYSPIIYSVTNGRGSVVQTFIDQGVSFETPALTNEDLNPLSLACQFGHEDIARLLLQRGAKVLPNPAGYYPQHLAAREGHAGVLRLLVDATRGFSGIDIPDKYSQATPLLHASSEGHAESVNILLQAGSDVRAKDEFRKTPIHYAAWNGHIDCINLLLAAGATASTIISPEYQPGNNQMAPLISADIDPMDLESDLIPSLSLPPPIIPFRICKPTIYNPLFTRQRKHTEH